MHKVKGEAYDGYIYLVIHVHNNYATHLWICTEKYKWAVVHLYTYSISINKMNI